MCIKTVGARVVGVKVYSSSSKEKREDKEHRKARQDKVCGYGGAGGVWCVVYVVRCVAIQGQGKSGDRESVVGGKTCKDSDARVVGTKMYSSMYKE